MKDKSMFTPVSNRAASTYRQVGIQSSIQGASPHTLIVMLFDGLLSSLAEARGAMERGQVEEKGRHIGRAVRIIEECDQRLMRGSPPFVVPGKHRHELRLETGARQVTHHRTQEAVVRHAGSHARRDGCRS